MKKVTEVVLLLGMLMVLAAGCASVPLAPAELDQQAKNMSAPENKALLYLYRNEMMGSAIKMTVNVDGKYIGQTASKTYFMLFLDPGKHDINSVTENKSDLPLETKAGEIYYVWQEVKMGFLSARSNLQLVDKETGKKGVEDCKLIQQNP